LNLSRGVDFVGFRNFYYSRLLRKRNLRNIRKKIELFNKGKISKEKFKEILQGWIAYVNLGNNFMSIQKLLKSIHP